MSGLRTGFKNWLEECAAEWLAAWLEESLEESDPCGMDLTTKQAYALLAEIRPVLLEAGFDVIVPEWWGQPASRLGARLMIQSGETDPSGSSGAGASSGVSSCSAPRRRRSAEAGRGRRCKGGGSRFGSELLA